MGDFGMAEPDEAPQPQQQPPPIPGGQPSAPQPGVGGRIKQMLTNYVSNIGATLAHEPTDFEKRQIDIRNQLRQQQADIAAQQAQSMEGLRKSQADANQMVPFQLPNGATIQLPAAHAAALGAAMYRSDAQQKVADTNAQARTDTATINADAKAKPSPYGKVNPIVAAQVGPPPDPATDPAGAKLWGVQAEAIQDRMASASGAARGIAYNKSRIDTYVDPQTQELTTTTAGDAVNRGLIKTAPGFQAMSKDAQFQEIQQASGKFRSAINGLDKDFSPTQIAQLTLASKAPSEGVLANVTNSLLGDKSLTPAQQDYIIWQNQMMERVLSIRNIAGMGQGSESMRAAIQGTIPSAKAGGKDYALKKLDAVDNQIGTLYHGIPKMPGAGVSPSQPIFAVNKSTNERVQSTDGGKTWQPAK